MGGWCCLHFTSYLPRKVSHFTPYYKRKERERGEEKKWRRGGMEGNLYVIILWTILHVLFSHSRGCQLVWRGVTWPSALSLLCHQDSIIWWLSSRKVSHHRELLYASSFLHDFFNHQRNEDERGIKECWWWRRRTRVLYFRPCIIMPEEIQPATWDSV